MNWKFWKKQEYKRPKYYPKCVISYETYVDSDPEDRFISANWCCNKMKKFFDIDRLKIGGSKTYFPGTEGYTTYYCMGRAKWDTHLYAMRHFKRLDGFPLDKKKIKMPIFYCPFCGAKIELNQVVKYERKEIIEEIIEPAKTKKVCKYDWQEVKS